MRLRKLLAIGGVVMAVAAGFVWTFGIGSDREPAEAGGIVVAPVAREAGAPAARPSAAGPVKPPPEVRAALEVGDGALLREPIPAEAMGGIVCGQVSPTGKPADFRRFVYNGSGRTGGIDDGSEVFRKFADKICVLQRQS